MFGLLPPALAQFVLVSPTNRTLEVTVTETVEVDPEVAVIRVGYRNYGGTKEQAYDENVRVSNKITQSLLDAGMPRESIRTETLRLDRAEPEEGWSPEMRAERIFFARQSWSVSVPAPQVPATVELAVRAGANDLSDVDWQVKDPTALEVKAHLAGLAKAKSLAAQMANGQGAKLGQLLYANNSFERFPAMEAMAYKAVPPPPPHMQVRLFPRKVSKEAAVHVIYSLE
jgi:uncharacterized protein YggE